MSKATPREERQRLTIRVPPELRTRLEQSARNAKRSLTRQAEHLLEQAVGAGVTHEEQPVLQEHTP